MIVVDLYGNMPDWDGINELRKRHGITVIEDAAEAIGSTYQGIRAGKFGIASTFQLPPHQNPEHGRGRNGVVRRHRSVRAVQILRDHGRLPGTYYNTEATFKYMPFNLSGGTRLRTISSVSTNSSVRSAGYGGRTARFCGYS